MPRILSDNPEAVRERERRAARRAEVREGVTEITEDIMDVSPSEGEIVAVNPERPWEAWPDDEVVNAQLHDLSAVPTGAGVVFRAGDRELGTPAPEFMREVGWNTQFPRDFVLKLPPSLQAEVINARLQASEDRAVSLIVEGERLTHFARGNRDLLPYRRTAEVAYEVVAGNGADSTDINVDVSRNGHLQLTLLTARQEPVTRQLGDVLRQGVRVRQGYGTTTEVACFVSRLVCLNGMTAESDHFRWSQRSHNSAEEQEQWLRASVIAALGYFQRLTENARLMAETRVAGDPRAVLEQRARALHVPRNLHGELLSAFDEEPGDTEWHLVNALTRLATHNERVSERQRRLLFETAGAFTGEFNLVEAVLPAGIAERVGARIVQQINEATEAVA